MAQREDFQDSKLPIYLKIQLRELLLKKIKGNISKAEMLGHLLEIIDNLDVQQNPDNVRVLLHYVIHLYEELED